MNLNNNKNYYTLNIDFGEMPKDPIEKEKYLKKHYAFMHKIIKYYLITMLIMLALYLLSYLLFINSIT